MLKIYAIPVSLYCAKLRIALRHKGLHWTEEPPPGGYGSDEYKTVIPSGNLPAMIDGDLLLADSEAIAEYLEEKHPDPPLLPDSAADRAKARERGRFHDTRLEPELRKLFSYLPWRQAAPEAMISDQSAAISAMLTQLAQMLEPEAGMALTLGDCGFPITFSWLHSLTPLTGLNLMWPEPVTEYEERLSRLPAVAAELEFYTPKLARYLRT